MSEWLGTVHLLQSSVAVQVAKRSLCLYSWKIERWSIFIQHVCKGTTPYRVTLAISEPLSLQKTFSPALLTFSTFYNPRPNPHTTSTGHITVASRFRLRFSGCHSQNGTLRFAILGLAFFWLTTFWFTSLKHGFAVLLAQLSTFTLAAAYSTIRSLDRHLVLVLSWYPD